MTVLVLALALALALALITLGLKRGQKLSTPSIEDQVLEWSTKFGSDAAAQKFDLPLKAVRRLRVLHQVEPRACGSCVHFDLEKGQTAISSHNIISQVTRALPPAILSKNPKSTESWNEFGACLKRPGLIIGPNDWCGKPEWKGGPEDLWA